MTIDKMERNTYSRNRDPYVHSWGYGSTTPFTGSVIFKDNHPKTPKKEEAKETKNRSLLQKIMDILLG